MSIHGRIATAIAAGALTLAGAGVALTLPGAGQLTLDVGVLGMNLVVAVAFPVVGAVIARHRPGHLLASVFSGAGLGAAATLFAFGYARYALESAPGALPGGILAGWASSWVWTTGVVPLVTLGLLLFPDGRLPSRRWRPVAVAVFAAMALLAAANALRPGPLANHPTAANPLGIAGAEGPLAVAGAVGFLLFVGAFVAALGSIVLRWQRARGAERRQLRWLLYAVGVLAVAFLADLVAPSPAAAVLAVAALAFLPVAIGIAVVREQLYDIDVLISRSLVYGVLTAGVVVVYVVVVVAVGGLLGRRAGFVGGLVATGVVAVAFQPARELVQARVSRLVYGAQVDPYTALARLARRLEESLDPEAVPSTVVETIATSLGLEHAAIELAEDGGFRQVAAYGPAQAHATEVSLTQQGRVIGRLLLGARRSGEPLTAAERRLLTDLARQAGVAIHGVRLTAALRRSRERLVVAREEERRRLHRDLHDGVGPTLAAVTLQLDVLRRLIPGDAEPAQALAAQLKADVQAAIPEIRRLIDDLRPAALDELGLVAALRQQAVALGAPQAVRVTVTADGELPRLSAAAEVAAYRIATEAITNVVRHAGARRCQVRIAYNGALHVEVEDDGCGIPEHPQAGVGLASMRERSAELGGDCSIERGPRGGTVVRARLPVAAP